MRCTHRAMWENRCASGRKPRLNGWAASLDAARKISWTNGKTPISAAEILSPINHCEPAKCSSISLNSLRTSLRGLLDFFGFVQSLAKENRANDFVVSCHDIRFTFGEHAPDQTCFLRRVSEERRSGVFAIEITHDRK